MPWSLGLGSTQDSVSDVQPRSPEGEKTSFTSSKSWSSAHFQTKLVKPMGQLVPHDARILSQDDAGNREAETGRDCGLKLRLFLLRLV